MKKIYDMCIQCGENMYREGSKVVCADKGCGNWFDVGDVIEFEGE